MWFVFGTRVPKDVELSVLDLGRGHAFVRVTDESDERRYVQYRFGRSTGILHTLQETKRVKASRLPN